MKIFKAYILLLLAFTYQIYSSDIIVDELKKQEIYFVNFLFSDITGEIKEVLIPIDHVQDALEHGIPFDGSSVAGCAHISNSDMLLKPDLSSTRITPWLQGINKTAIMLCDIYVTQDEPFLASPRNLLKEIVNEVGHHGYTCNVGPELEFFILNQENKPIDSNSYFDAEYNIKRYIQKQTLVHILKSMGVNVEKLHHEVASGQHEFSIKYGDPVLIADQVVLAKYALKNYIQECGLNVTFMPKPFANQNGSAMHIHFSLWDALKNKNAFYNQDDEHNFSTIGKQFLAGVLHHMPDTSILFNPTINSFKRLVPGYEAPTYICWGTKNRSALIRLPETDNPESVRAELRCPDPMCNPYIAFAALLKSGLDGIIHQQAEPTPREEDLYALTKEERLKNEITSLPADLQQALHNFKHSSFIQQFCDNGFMSSFIALKDKELHDYNTHISEWEKIAYL